MTSSFGSRTRSGETSPQVRPNTSTSARPLASQLRLQFSRHSGVLSLSDRITFAPHLAANTPGRLTPAPSCRRVKNKNGNVCHVVKAPLLKLSSVSPPAASGLSAPVVVSTDTEPEPQRRATHTCRTVDPEPESEEHSLPKT